MYDVERGTAEAGDPYYGAMQTRRDAEYEENNWLMFAGLMIFFTGLWNLFEGVLALFRSAYFTGTPVFGTLWFWGLVWIGIGVLEMGAAYAIMDGRSWARWFGIVLVGISAIVHMLAIPVYPWWSVFVLLIDIVIFYALAVRWPHRAREVSVA